MEFPFIGSLKKGCEKSVIVGLGSLWCKIWHRTALIYGSNPIGSNKWAIQLELTFFKAWRFGKRMSGLVPKRARARGDRGRGGCVGENKQKRTTRGLAHHSTIELSPLITIPSHLPLNVSTIGLGGHRITRLCTITRIILLEELWSIYGIIGTSCFDKLRFLSWPPMGVCVCPLLLMRSFH